jgi:hypothetical protein
MRDETRNLKTWGDRRGILQEVTEGTEGRVERRKAESRKQKDRRP